eukprot:g2261.t1
MVKENKHQPTTVDQKQFSLTGEPICSQSGSKTARHTYDAETSCNTSQPTKNTKQNVEFENTINRNFRLLKIKTPTGHQATPD